MTIITSPGIFVFLMKNTNNMQADEKLVKRLDTSKIDYVLGKDYLMTKKESLNSAIKELKGWHLI